MFLGTTAVVSGGHWRASRGLRERLGASLNIPGGFRTSLGPLKDSACSLFVSNFPPELSERPPGADVSSFLGAPDFENHCFYLGKPTIFTKSTFADRHTFLARFSCLVMLRGCLWNPFATVFGALGRSCRFFERSCAGPETYLEHSEKPLRRTFALLGARCFECTPQKQPCGSFRAVKRPRKGFAL